MTTPLTASTTNARNATTGPTAPALDAPADEEGSPRRLHRLVPELNRRSIALALTFALVVALSSIPVSHAQSLAVAETASRLTERATASDPANCACPDASSSGGGGEKHDAAFIVKACLIPLLVVLSGASAGLTIGFMTLDTTQLQVLIKSGSPQQQKWAAKVLPLRKNGHLLLITLLISNMIFNEALPVIAESVFGGGIQAVVASTAMIVVFAEVIPQSVCSRFGLRIGAAMVWPVRIMICVLFVIAWPIAKLLEWILGPHDGIVYRRTELKELVALHAESAGRHGDLDVDTVAIVGATLDLQVKTVKQAMTPISDLFSLPITAKLDFETLGKILEAGHSRIPVYEEIPVESDSNEKKTRRKVIGVLLTKQLILLDPEDATPLREIPINPLPLVADDLALLQILNTFQEGRSHMAIVCRRKFACAPAQSQPPLLETIPSASSDSDLERGTPGGGGGSKDEGFLHSLFRRKRSSSASSTRSSSTTHHEKRSVRSAAEVNVEKTAPPPSFSTLNVAAELDDEFPQGIITLEDVLEELIGEEILDETDQDASHMPSMSYYIPPEAYGKVGNLSGPPPAPSAHVAQQAKQKSSSSSSSSSSGGFVGRISMGRSRSAPGQRRSGDNNIKSASNSGTTTPREEPVAVGTESSSSGGGGTGPFGAMLGAFGGGNVGSKKRTPSPSTLKPLASPSGPRASDFATAASPSTTAGTTTPRSSSVTGQPQVEEPQSLAAIDETSQAPSPSSASAPHSASMPPVVVRPVASFATTPGGAAPPPPLPSPSLLSDAVLVERGRRALIAKGTDPATLNLTNLRLAGATTRSQPGSRSSTPTPVPHRHHLHQQQQQQQQSSPTTTNDGFTGTAAAAAVHHQSVGGSSTSGGGGGGTVTPERSASGTRGQRGAFKTPAAQMSALPQAARVHLSKDQKNPQHELEQVGGAKKDT